MIKSTTHSNPSTKRSENKERRRKESGRLRTLGIDSSLTSTGLVVWDGSLKEAINLKTSPHEFTSDMERMAHIAKEIIEVVHRLKPDAIGIEAPAFHATAGNDSRPHEVRTLICYELFLHKYKYFKLHIQTNKKFLTGNGRASKKEMLEAARIIWPECPNDDMADALSVAKYTYENFEDVIERTQ